MRELAQSRDTGTTGNAALWSYRPSAGYDEVLAGDGLPRPLTAGLAEAARRVGLDGLVERQRAADEEIRRIGITYQTDYGAGAVDRPWPFDVLPRIIDSVEWQRIRDGLVQRLRALNLFIDDVYHDQRAIRDGIVPAEDVVGSPNFRPECVGIDPPGGIWAHICGSDLVRGEDGTVYVLEDNLRVPSGVSYLLENRAVAKRVFPELFRAYSVEPVHPYIGKLAEMLGGLMPDVPRATTVILTPGVHNSAYFEHAFLAQQLGVELVEGSDLVVEGDTLFMRTTGGRERVDVLYRRIDDAYLDPEVFRADSMIGVPGIMRAWRAGNVAIVSAPGAGVGDDKAVYAYVPEIIRYFLDEEPILPNVTTWRCGDADECRYVLDNLDALVVKPATESGGFGVVIGPHAGDDVLARVARRIAQYAPAWVAQPVVSLSTMPTLVDGDLEPRHVDLRPFAIIGPTDSYVAPGGLTRVAREAGSLIVNSSQGGGSKDTWVVDATLSPGAFADEREATGDGSDPETGRRRVVGSSAQ